MFEPLKKFSSKLIKKSTSNDDALKKESFQKKEKAPKIPSPKAAAAMEDKFIKTISKGAESVSSIAPELYSKYNVKRGLRNANGTGVIVGLTHIGDVIGYKVTESNEKIPIEGKLYYRGYDVEDLIHGCRKDNRFGFEETTFLLLTGKIPTKNELDNFNKLLGEKRKLPDGFARDMILSNPSRSIMNNLARSVLALYCYDNKADDTSVVNVMRQCIGLIGQFPALIAYAYQSKSSAFENESLHIHQPIPELSTAENILRMIRPTSEYTKLEAVLLDICLMLHAEHGGGNVSSFTTHLLSSSDTDTYAAISAAVGALKGPKHGGANIAVLNMMEDLKKNVKDITSEREVIAYLRNVLKKEANDGSGLIYGMGHAIYTLSDPRAVILKDMARKLASSKKEFEDTFQLYDTIERVAPALYTEATGNDKPMCANVDLYSGFVYDALGIPREIATPLFADARLSGWCAHRLEEIIAGKKIIRPAYTNVQPHMEYVKLEDRK